ncbi:MAG: hypothetical protein AAFX80_03030 [Cyanobacteria bacterium J06639_18]
MMKFAKLQSSVQNLLFASLLALLWSTPVQAEKELTSAEVYKILKQVQLLQRKQTPRPAQLKDVLVPLDALRTGEESGANLLFNEGSLGIIGSKTTFRFKLDMRQGEVAPTTTPNNIPREVAPTTRNNDIPQGEVAPVRGPNNIPPEVAPNTGNSDIRPEALRTRERGNIAPTTGNNDIRPEALRTRERSNIAPTTGNNDIRQREQLAPTTNRNSNRSTLEITEGIAIAMIPSEAVTSRIETPQGTADISSRTLKLQQPQDRYRSKGSAVVVIVDVSNKNVRYLNLTPEPITVTNTQRTQIVTLRGGQIVVINDGVIGEVQNFDLKKFYQTTKLAAVLDPEREDLVAKEPKAVQKTLRILRQEASLAIKAQERWVNGLCSLNSLASASTLSTNCITTGDDPIDNFEDVRELFPHPEDDPGRDPGDDPGRDPGRDPNEAEAPTGRF